MKASRLRESLGWKAGSWFGGWFFYLFIFLFYGALSRNPEFKRRRRIAHSSDVGSEPLFQFISLEREDEYMEIKQRPYF